MDLAILYEDEHLVAVNKPAGIVVHPTYKNASGTLLDAVRAYASGWPDHQNATIIGRLDKDTSGIVVAAKTATAHAALQRTWSASDSEKIYLAVVSAVVDRECGRITLPLCIDPADRRRVIVCGPDDAGSAAETRFERLDTRHGLTLLRCRPMTGRRHQIRVHLAACGWPIVGDRVYGEAAAGFRRHALHAWRTAFTHPFTGERRAIEAALPTEFRQLLDRC
jgi:23S rRNA pseudouridine1911/1915/1917 synthase